MLDTLYDIEIFDDLLPRAKTGNRSSYVPISDSIRMYAPVLPRKLRPVELQSGDRILVRLRSLPEIAEYTVVEQTDDLRFIKLEDKHSNAEWRDMSSLNIVSVIKKK